MQQLDSYQHSSAFSPREAYWEVRQGKSNLINEFWKENLSCLICLQLLMYECLSIQKRSFPDDGECGLDPEDQYLCFEALDFLVSSVYVWYSH